MNDTTRLPLPPQAADTPSDKADVTGQDFRNCIARLPSGVHIVTTAGSAGSSGFTATAVASVSDDPPTILVCLNRKSPQNQLLKDNACFAVNLLPKNEVELANIFAGRTGLHFSERFAHGNWTTLTTGAPVLANSVMSLDCQLLQFHEIGTHTIFYGAVVGTRVKPVDPNGAREILVYHDRHYSEI
ncbi:flavin reductase [Oryzibacter oryziterrae]|uniref:flavin reductase n=1 Tax=Oryzibacter oryziterrae TaxID=2766474 RepID=UPI001F003413|nr:flavin reductase [Oryzibacter oryziterrae]